MPVALDPIDHATAADFVAKFEDVWRDTPDLRKHEALWSPDIVLTQPLMGTLRGPDECRAGFGRLFRQIPDLHAVVHRWGHSDDAILIEFTLRGTFGGRELAWTAVDRFTLTGGLIAERVSYFDAAALSAAMVGRPRGWRRMVATRFVPRFERYVHP
jgi:ketosteroid isomerase-like protein